MLFGLSPADPLTFGAAAVILTAVCVVATSVPARRASRIDPMVALKVESRQVIFLTSLAVAILLALACVGFYLSRHVSRRQQITSLRRHADGVRVDRPRFCRGAQPDVGSQARQGSTHLRCPCPAPAAASDAAANEMEALNGIAGALRDGRSFTEVANDARQAVWHDDVLTTDVERHFPEYARERKRLIQNILE